MLAIAIGVGVVAVGAIVLVVARPWRRRAPAPVVAEPVVVAPQATPPPRRHRPTTNEIGDEIIAMIERRRGQPMAVPPIVRRRMPQGTPSVPVSDDAETDGAHRPLPRRIQM